MATNRSGGRRQVSCPAFTGWLASMLGKELADGGAQEPAQWPRLSRKYKSQWTSDEHAIYLEDLASRDAIAHGVGEIQASCPYSP